METGSPVRSKQAVALKHNEASANFLALDGLRGVAALFVSIFHTAAFWEPLYFHHSYLAVDLFFVLSGFVIEHAYGAKLRSGQTAFKKFLLIRLIRLYPMYFLASLIAVAAVFNASASTSQFWLACMSTFAFLPASLPGNIYLFPFNRPCWSVFYEVVSNVAYGLNSPVLTDRLLLFTIAGLGVAVVTLAFLHGGINAGGTWRMTSVVSGLTRSCFGLLYGVLIYRHRHQLKRLWRIPAVMVIAVIAASFMTPDLHSFNALYDVACCFVVYPLCVLIAARASVGPLLSKLFEFIGRPSYTIYLIHVPVAMWVSIAYDPYISRFAPMSGILLFALIFLIANLLERLLDSPARIALRVRLEAQG